MSFFQKLLPAPSRDAQARDAREYLVSTGIEVSKNRYDAEGFGLVVEGGHTYFLGNLFAFYCRAWPWQRRSTVAGFLGSMAGTMEARPKTLDSARPNLLVAVRDQVAFEQLRIRARIEGGTELAIPQRKLGNRLAVCVVIDFPTSTSLVTEQDLVDWKVSFDEVLGLGAENLARRTEAAPRFQEIAPGTYLSPWSDCYDTARIFVDRVFSGLDIKGEPVVACPNWNRLLVGGMDRPESLVGVISAGMHIVSEEPRSMSGMPLVRREGQWIAVELARGHVAESILRKARVLEMNGIYQEQKERLDRLHEKTGEDIFVAKFMATVHEKTQEYFSQAVWSKGVVGLLPLTERIAFFDNDREKDKIECTADWEIAAQYCSSLMKATEYTPLRIRVEEYPSADLIVKMKEAQGKRSE